MKVASQRILVCSPSAVTGGPELLHQLVHELRGLGRDAYITYYPFGQTFAVPEPYRIYDTPVAPFSDDPDTFVVVPETSTWIVRHVRRGQAAVWWMSVDNYFFAKRESWIADAYQRAASLLSGTQQPLFRMRHLQHLVQSEYARAFLEARGLPSAPLTDYLNPAHLHRPEPPADGRENLVVYNPKKGVRKTQALMQRYPDLHFAPLQNMTAAQVGDLLARAKLYVDFGHHPGKDRAPREAALAGCCVITGQQGAAENTVDIPIPAAYKLDDRGTCYLDAFGPLVQGIFGDFPRHTKGFQDYRAVIRGERGQFEQQVRQIFL